MRRILSIDGGGIKGVFAASFLARIEDVIGRSVVDYFDLVAGTSTGGLIALSLGLGFDARTTVRRYEDASPKIFRSLGWLGRIRHIVTSKYSPAPLKRELEMHFGELCVQDCKVRLLVPTMDVANNKVHIYKTPHHPTIFTDASVSAVNVSLAAVAAPTYFPLHRTQDGAAMIDGGIWAHNPALLAIIEALGLLNWPKEDVSVLSIGLPPEDLAWGLRKSARIGAYEAGFTIANLFTNAQQVSAIVNARLLLSDDRVVRIEPSDRSAAIPLDSVRSIPLLKEMGEREADRQIGALRTQFFSKPSEPFVSSLTESLGSDTPTQVLSRQCRTSRTRVAVTLRTPSAGPWDKKDEPPE